jgi:hypothetical protein
MTDIARDTVLHELEQAPAAFRELLVSAPPNALSRRTSGTRWTNREMLFHLLLGYGLVRILLPLVAIMDRLPPWAGRGFAATLNSAATAFHVVNYVGSVVGGRVLPPRRMAMLFDHTCTALTRRLNAQNAADLRRGMPFPVRWDPFFTTRMSVLDVYHYPWQHFQFHRRQLTIDAAA